MDLWESFFAFSAVVEVFTDSAFKSRSNNRIHSTSITDDSVMNSNTFSWGSKSLKLVRNVVLYFVASVKDIFLNVTKSSYNFILEVLLNWNNLWFFFLFLLEFMFLSFLLKFLFFFKWELLISQSTLILPVIISAYLNVSSSYTTSIYLFQYFYSLFLFIWEISLFSSLMNILYHILFILSVDFLKVF